jgi:hypothetical protein
MYKYITISNRNIVKVLLVTWQPTEQTTVTRDKKMGHGNGKAAMTHFGRPPSG